MLQFEPYFNKNTLIVKKQAIDFSLAFLNLFSLHPLSYVCPILLRKDSCCICACVSLPLIEVVECFLTTNFEHETRSVSGVMVSIVAFQAIDGGSIPP